MLRSLAERLVFLSAVACILLAIGGIAGEATGPQPVPGPAKIIDREKASLAEAIEDWIGLIERNDLATAKTRWAKDEKAAESLAQYWPDDARRPAEVDYLRKWINGFTLKDGRKCAGTRDSGESKTFKIGGHGKELGHQHIDWEKTDKGWRLQQIWLCD